MKRTIALLLGVATILGASSAPVLAKEKKIKENTVISTNKVNEKISNNLIIAGKAINIGNAGVVIKNGNVMVPLKVTAENLGFKVSSDSHNKIITLDNNQVKTEIEVGRDNYYYQSSNAIGSFFAKQNMEN
ncbi:stalk domain-containing protein [Haloimpatiens sp. FM7315]|uniref:stalk domain-containing protein n=1 Tax=Haloimpatiens sp. FM7315 TaxID=3298609 RepID=UPI00370CE899